jgi:hypothetical protein
LKKSKLTNPEFRIEKDTDSSSIKNKLKPDPLVKAREKVFKGTSLNRKSGDYCKLTKKYQMLNHSEKTEGTKRTQKVEGGSLTSQYFRKGYKSGVGVQAKNRKYSTGNRSSSISDKDKVKVGFKHFRGKEDSGKYDTYQKNSNRSIENNIKSKKKKFYSIDKYRSFFCN